MSKHHRKSKTAPSTAVAVPPALLALAVIAVATFAAYLPALGGGVLWDDDAHIPRVELRSFNGLVRMWTEVKATQQYYPLLFSWFWLQYHLWGEHMLGYHVVNVLLHIGAAWLVYVILQRLKIPGALLATAIFALHPVHVESVAWVSEQKNTLSAVFYLGAMLTYLRFDESRKLSWYALALGLFIAALLSKTATVTLPAALLVIFWYQRGRVRSAAGPDDPPRLAWRRDVLPLVPFFAAALCMGLVTVWVERDVLGAKGDWFERTWAERILLAGRAVWFYLLKLVWPANLTLVYPRWELDASDWRQWLYPLSVVAVLVALWAIRGRTRAPLAAALYFVGTLFPVLGFFNVYFFRYSLVADHFQYLPSLGPIVLASGAVATWLARATPQVRWAGSAGCVLLAAILATLSTGQSRFYGDAIMLYRETIARNPQAWVAYNNLGAEYYHAGRSAEALDILKRAIEIDPLAPDAYCNLGGALFESGQIEAGLEQYRETIRKFPQFVQAYNNLGGTLLKVDRPQEAIEPLRKALELKPDYADAQNNLGAALLNSGQAREAIPYLKQAIQYNPTIVEAHVNLGISLAAVGDPAAAVVPLREAVQMRPDYMKAWANLAMENGKLGHTFEAIAACEKALALARAQGQARAAAQLEAMLGQYRAALGGAKQP